MLRYRFVILVVCCWSCSNIEDASPSSRSTFVRFYESSVAQSGVVAEPVEDGYIILTNTLSNNDTTGTIIHTDLLGQVTWRSTISNCILKALKISANGYFILADSIKTNPEAEQIADLIITSAILYKTDLNGNVMEKVVIADRDTVNRTDFGSSALNFNQAGNVVMLGTFKAATLASSTRPFVAVFDPQNLDLVWSKNYDVNDRDYVNSKSVHAINDGYIIWASALLREQQNFARSYLTIPIIREESTFENYDDYGETTDQRLFVNDIQPAASQAFGFGLVGMYASPIGENSNMFFARVTKDGNFIKGSERFFDAQHLANGETTAIDESASEDTGNALCATQDGGFVLAGTMLTTPAYGNGGTDIFLVKVDAQGNVLWSKIMGGSSDEVVSTIRETPDGGLLICGSKDASGLPAAFIMKTDKNGEIKN